MDRAERSVKAMRKLRQAVLPPGVEQQRGEDVGLQLGRNTGSSAGAELRIN
jgi:hypothetical protein